MLCQRSADVYALGRRGWMCCELLVGGVGWVEMPVPRVCRSSSVGCAALLGCDCCAIILAQAVPQPSPHSPINPPPTRASPLLYRCCTAEVLGMKLLRTRDNPEYKYTLAFLGAYRSCVAAVPSNSGSTQQDVDQRCHNWQPPGSAVRSHPAPRACCLLVARWRPVQLRWADEVGSAPFLHNALLIITTTRFYALTIALPPSCPRLRP